MNNIFPVAGEIDFVYIWCNPLNPIYISERKRYEKEYKRNTFRSPTRDHNEIKYSILSVRKYMKRIRNIYICCPAGHRISTLDAEKYGVIYIDNKDILGKEHCPNFNSHSLEIFTHKIEGLSEFYLQSNDDFFISGDVDLDFYYNHKTNKIKYYYENILVFGGACTDVTRKCTKELLDEDYYFWPCHCPRMFCKKDVIAITKKYKDSIEKTKKAKFRTKDDFQIIYMYGYYILNGGTGDFIFLKNIAGSIGIINFIKMLFDKIITNGFLGFIHQVYLEVIYKKKLHVNKQFLDTDIYSLIHITTNYEKNMKQIDQAFDKGTKHICLNDDYGIVTEHEGLQINQIYKYFYNRLLEND